MANFKVIYRVDTSSKGDDALTWETGCPLLFEAIQISRNTETGDAYLQGKLLNISNQKIQSFKALITVEYEDGNTETAEFNPLDADILDGAVYKLEPVLLKQGNAIKASGRIESVKLASEKWESAANPTIIPEPQPIGLSEEAIQERYEEIWKPLKSHMPLHERKKIAANRLEEHEGWWLCPCGQVNVEKGTCAKCGASLNALQNPNAVNEEALAAAAKERKSKKEQKAKKNKKTIRIAVTTVATVALITIVSFIGFQAWQDAKYNEGLTAFESRDYAAASVIFQELGGYQDSNEFYKYCDAMEKYESALYGKVARKFESLGSFNDSRAMAKQAEFMANISNSLNKSCKGNFYYKSYDPSGVSLVCEITLNSDGTCKIVVSRDKNESAMKYGADYLSKYIGEWEGTWNPSNQELTLDSFPSGETWHVDAFSHTDLNGAKTFVPIIRSSSQKTGSNPNQCFLIDR